MRLLERGQFRLHRRSPGRALRLRRNDEVGGCHDDTAAQQHAGKPEAIERGASEKQVHDDNLHGKHAYAEQVPVHESLAEMLARTHNRLARTRRTGADCVTGSDLFVPRSEPPPAPTRNNAFRIWPSDIKIAIFRVIADLSATAEDGPTESLRNRDV